MAAQRQAAPDAAFLPDPAERGHAGTGPIHGKVNGK